MIDLAYPRGSDNIGDELNAWLWPALLGDLMVERQVTLMGIGTLLNESFCRQLPLHQDIFVMGTGAGYGPPPQRDQRWKFYAVRGPRTAAALGLPGTCAVADAAYLLASLDWHDATSNQPAKEVILVPHHRSLSLLDWASVCRQADVSFLSPLLPAGQFMAGLVRARLVLTEAMHGAILADMARVPWRAFSFGKQFNRDKWLDWAEALEINLEPNEIRGFYDPLHAPHLAHSRAKHYWRRLKASISAHGLGKSKWKSITPPSRSVERDVSDLAATLRRLATSVGQLSDERILLNRTERLLNTVNALRHDLAGGGAACRAFWRCIYFF
ncbi:MAG: polysaccharide pyruvyl transferase family protein [Azonexus sp.]|jgi:succinoglycan biosynthesis protein ExoV|nr:polysaccharide pyruvyl transferase family protein [Azonexus sp.]